MSGLERAMWKGLPIIVSPYALKDGTVRLFPASRHRSRRITKKLVKRFGGVFRKEPCMYQTPQGLVAHPALYAELKASVAIEQRGDGNPW